MVVVLPSQLSFRSAAHGDTVQSVPCAVRTLNCEGLAKADQVVLAMDWVLENHRKPAVVQMSLTTQSIEPSMDRAASTLVAAGLAVIAAAGNFNTSKRTFSSSCACLKFTIQANQ